MKYTGKGFRIFGTVLILLSLLIWPVQGGGAEAADKPLFKVGYMPIFPSAPEFIKAAKGWYGKEMNVRVKEFRFSSGPPIVQAFAAGQLDIAYFGMGPSIVSVAKGIKAKVLTSIVTEQVAVIGRNQFAKDYKANPGKSAFHKFAKENGRNMKIATFPPGSTPHVMLLMWLDQLGLNPKREVDVVPMGSAQVRQAVLAQRVDATMILEPIITIIRRSGIPYSPVIEGKKILPGQPGSVLFVRQELINKYPRRIEKLVELNLRAIRMLKENHGEAAKILSKKIGSKVISAKMAKDVLASPFMNWTANPHKIVNGTIAYNKFQVKMGRFKKPLAMNKLFDFTFYDKVVAKHPDLKKY